MYLSNVNTYLAKIEPKRISNKPFVKYSSHTYFFYGLLVHFFRQVQAMNFIFTILDWKKLVVTKLYSKFQYYLVLTHKNLKPIQREESGYPVLRNFASHLGLASVIPPNREAKFQPGIQKKHS